MIRSASLVFAALLSVSATAATDIWDIASGDGGTITGGNGAWSTGAGNWNTGSGDTTWTAGDTASFTSSTASVVTLGSAVSVGGITLGSGAGQVTLNATGTNAITAVANTSVNLAAGTVLTVSGSGSNFTLNAAGTSITGGGTFEVAAGTTTVTSSPNNGDAAFTLGSGTTIQVDTGATFQYLMGWTAGNTSGGAIALNGGSFLTGGGLAGAVAANITGSGTLGANSASSGTVVQSFTGTISGSGAINLQNTASSTASFMIVSGANSGYAGSFALNGASGSRTVRFDSLNATGTGSVSVAANNTLSLNVGGSNFTTGNVATLLARTTFAANAGLAFDTTGGSFTYATALADSVSGALRFVKYGSNDLNLNTAGTYTGGTTLAAGRTTINNAAAFGTGAVTIASGAQAYLSNGGTVANNFILNGGSGGDGRGVMRINNATVSGTVTLAANSVISGAGSEAGTISGAVGESGGARSLTVGSTSASANNLVKLTLTGTNTYSGGTVINGGTSNISTVVTGNTSALGAGGVTLAGGILQIGNGTVNTVTLASGANLATAASTPSSVIKFNTVGSAVTLAGGGKYNFSAGTITLDLNNAFNAANTYNLISGGTGNVDAGSYTFANTTAGFNYAFANGVLTVTAVPEPSTYGLIGAGALAATALVRRRRRA